MANLPTTMEYFDNLLGEQLTEGGGGSSDFSTATLTINFTGDNAKVGENAYFDIYAPSTLYSNGGCPPAYGTDDAFGITPYVQSFGADEIKQGQIVCPVVLYKGSALWSTQLDSIAYSWDNSNLLEPNEWVLSGQISHNNEWSDGLYKIAGDCAVTIRLLNPQT